MRITKLWRGEKFVNNTIAKQELTMVKCPYCGAWKVKNAVCPTCERL